MNRTFGNVYEDEERARAYATLQFPGTYYLAFRDLPALIRRYNHGRRALDFGCGTGRSTRFLRNFGLEFDHCHCNGPGVRRDVLSTVDCARPTP
jgi:SAM-dependent methyltransferase